MIPYLTLLLYFYLPTGVTVASVEEGSPAAAAGLVAGSIVYSINNIPVSARVVVGR